jgi:hypothetical protein
MSPALTPSPEATSKLQEYQSERLHCASCNDATSGSRQPFIAIKETNPASGAWRVRIQSRHAASAVLYPAAIRLQARAVSEQGRSWFTWTNPAAAGSGSTDRIKLRVLVSDGEPAAIEVFPRPATMPSGNGEPPLKFCWPAA